MSTLNTPNTSTKESIKEILGGFFLGVCFFVIPLTVWIIRTGGL